MGRRGAAGALALKRLAVGHSAPPSPGQWRASTRSEGYYLVQDYTETVDGRSSIQVHAVFAWDEEQRQYLLYWFDSYGFAPQAPGGGQWDGDMLTLIAARSSRGMARIIDRFEGADAYRHRHAGKPVAAASPGCR